MAERNDYEKRGRTNGSYNGNGFGGNAFGGGNSDSAPGGPLGAYVPPHSIEAEQSTLGAMLIERSAVEKVFEVLDKEDFYRENHQIIFDVISFLTERDEPIDLITVPNELKNRDQLDAVGGMAYLAALFDTVPTAANAEYYAKIVEEKATLRRLISASLEIIGSARGEVEDVGEVLDEAERSIFSVSQQRATAYFSPLRTLLLSVYDKAEELSEMKSKISGLSTGIHDFDMITSGLQNTDLIIVAARPSMGKCVRYDTLIDDPLTGNRVMVEAWVKQRLPAVLGVSELGTVRTAPVGGWVDSGVKPCFRVRTCTGRTVDVTGHHPFMTVHGWTPLHDLSAGSKIAVPRRVPAFGMNDTMPLDLVRLMAYFIAEGGLTGTSPSFTNTDPVIISDFQQIISQRFSECSLRQERITYTVVRQKGQKRLTVANPVTRWLRELGLMGKLADAKSFPECVWRWTQPHLAEFLRVLMSCDGTIYNMGGYPRIEFAVASEKLALDVHHALTRFGIVAKFWQKTPRCWRVEITEPASVTTYQTEIGWIGEKAHRFGSEFKRRRANSGHLPPDAWRYVKEALAAQSLSFVELARQSGETASAGKYGGYNPHLQRGVPQNRLARYAEVLDDADLRRLASQDLYWDEIVSIEPLGEHQVYDLSVPDGANFIAQDICVHNTSLCLSIAEHVALKEKKPVAIFSLEMSKEQLALRMLCSQAQVNSHKLRTGHMNEDEWGKLAGVVQNMYESPIFIDDATETSALTMRSKCRRLMAEHGLGLIIVDYLQLMRSHRRTENRVQEIGEIARGLKSLGRELKVPVIALSQLSRAVESRENKRPMLSDLRECVVGDTRLMNADTGKLVAIRDVQAGDSILAMDSRQKVCPFPVERVWSTGVKPVFTLKTRTGRSVTATANHPLLTAQGWKRVDELQPGDIIATAMRLPEYGTEKPEHADLCRLLGYLVGDGTFQTHRAVGFCGSEPAAAEDVLNIVTQHFPEVTTREKKSYGSHQEFDFRCLYDNGYGNPLREWLRGLGVLEQKDNTKQVPEWVWEAGQVGASNFLAGYFSADGCVKQTAGRGWFVYFDTVSRQLAEDVQLLLLRLGIIATVNDGYQSAKATQLIYRISVAGFADNLRRFAASVRPGGRKELLLERMVSELPNGVTNGSLFGLPPEVSDLLFDKSKHLRQQGRKREAGPRLYWKPQGKRPRRDICVKFAESLKDEVLSVWANSDLLWEETKSITPSGEEEVFDITVPGCANFLANGIVAHNSGSIEAEADMVCFLYREAYYKMKEAFNTAEEEGSDRPQRAEMEETEIIVGKHRNGPTGMVKVGFMAEYAKFVDLDLSRTDEPTGF
jgi:replicative DNA helicase